MDNSAYFEVVKETVKQFENIMNVSLKGRVKDSVKKAMGRSVRTKDPLFWPAGMLMLGLINAAEYLDALSEIEALGNDCAEAKKLLSEIDRVMEQHVDTWFYKYKGKIEYVDDALAGYCFLKMYERTENQKFLVPAKHICNYILHYPRDNEGSVIYNASRGGKIIFADGVGQVSMFTSEYRKCKVPEDTRPEQSMTGDVVNSLANAFGGVLDKVIGEAEAIPSLEELEEALIRNYYKFGRDEKSGLIYHGYELGDARRLVPDGLNRMEECASNKKGLMCWGRAFGWLMMGLSNVAGGGLGDTGASGANNNTGASNADAALWFKELSGAAIDYQRPDGGWSWQLQAIDGHIDMSATGMIAYSLAMGARNGILPASKTKEVIEKAAVCMSEHIKKGAVVDALSSCDDFGVHYQTYGSYPWGQGAVLAALSVSKFIYLQQM